MVFVSLIVEIVFFGVVVSGFVGVLSVWLILGILFVVML